MGTVFWRTLPWGLGYQGHLRAKEHQNVRQVLECAGPPALSARLNSQQAQLDPAGTSVSDLRPPPSALCLPASSAFHPPSSIPYLPPVHFRKVTIVGVGLLGGSLGLALKKRRLADEVAGYVRRKASIIECKKAAAVDSCTTDLHEAVQDADLIVLCTPLAQMLPLFKEMRTSIKRGAILTDVGSVKTTVVKELESLVAKAGAHFIGSHPMAGAEKTGVAAARESLFENAVCVVTPTRKSNQAALKKTEQLWKAVGARVMRLAPELHDELVSRSSHLPHVVAATLANLVLDPKHPKSQPLLCANGFRDTTRIASGSPEMWRDIAVANRKNLSKALDTFIRELKTFQKALNRTDEKAAEKFFAQGKQRRDAWCARCASPSPE
ncbi:MAG TPA: prephenate dehydrogenase/arogenate dehydrogenase family protein [Verrucomicrobiae bacterium]|nr:prephenate dehydrogenase/arogenate dehydrogenase family protein [Verrucomicrobiae bacterium]